ncbi:hypothetical protein [Natronospora cellulosivora (SeqCode)]
MKSKKMLFIVMIVFAMLLNLIACDDLYAVTIEVQGEGYVLDPGEGEYYDGKYYFDDMTTLTLFVQADEGYEFIAWAGDDGEFISDADDDGSFLVSVDRDMRFIAVFAEIKDDESDALAAETQELEEIDVENTEDVEVAEDDSLFNFERTNYFDVENGSANLALDDSMAYLGNSSLRIDYEFANSRQMPNIHFTDYIAEYYPALRNGVYYFRVYVPFETQLPSVQAFVQTNANGFPWYGETYILGQDIQYDEWVTIEVDMSNVNDGGEIYKLGIQLQAPENPGRWEGTLWLDSVTYEL